MTHTELLTRIKQTGIVPVLRAPSPSLGLRLAEAIAAGGIDTLEITLTIPGAATLIAELRKKHPQLLIGAGTVLDQVSAQRCIDHGAQFIVSPALHAPTIELCQQANIPIFPGALTPTEIVTAWQLGASAIKVFPASAMGGAPYLKSIKAPLPHIPLLPTGGITLANAAEFLAAGAIALGVGADLCDITTLQQGRPEAITTTALAYREVVQTFQQAATKVTS